MTSPGTPLEPLDIEGLRALISPCTVAVVGASGRAGNPFARPLEYLLSYGYSGDIYPVNPGYDSLLGLPCFPNLEAVPGPIDLALMLVPAKSAVDLIPVVAKAGAKAAVIFASGFSETGAEGQALQAELAQAASAHGVRLIGPNCQGVLHAASNFYGTFTAALELGPISPGGLAYVGQSGAVGGSILSLARERGIGIASWVSTGNQADLDSVEVSRYLIEQAETTALALYIESATSEREFQALASRAKDLDKSLIVLRSATSEAGARAAASHTGAIVGSAAAFDAVVREYGVILAQDIDELVELAHAHTALPRGRGRSIVVVTTSGGAGSLAADLAERCRLDMVQLSEGSQHTLATVVPDFGATENPIDVTAQIFRDGDAADFLQVCQLAADLPEVDLLLVVLTLVTGDLAEKTARSLAALTAQSDKPVAIAWAAAHEQTVAAREILREAGIPVFGSVGSATAALSSLVPEDSVITPTGHAVVAEGVAQIVDQLQEIVTESDARPLMDELGIPRPKTQLITSRAEAETIAAGLGAPVVLKIQAPSVLHKTDRGGVLVGVNPADVPAEAMRLLELFAADEPQGVLVQDLAPAGIELIVGVTRSGDEGLPLVTVGLGGTATELYRDTATTLAPVDTAQARTLLLRTKAANLLTGYRSSEPYDLDAIADSIARISKLAVAAGSRLREVEVNPLRVTHDVDRPVQALDFMMILAPKENT